MTYPVDESMQLLADEKIDALMGFPPVPQELREKKIGHVIVNSRLDRPWSQYFCCMRRGAIGSSSASIRWRRSERCARS